MSVQKRDNLQFAKLRFGIFCISFSGSTLALRQIAVYEKCVNASFVLFSDQAFQVGWGQASNGWASDIV